MQEGPKKRSFFSEKHIFNGNWNNVRRNIQKPQGKITRYLNFILKKFSTFFMSHPKYSYWNKLTLFLSFFVFKQGKVFIFVPRLLNIVHNIYSSVFFADVWKKNQQIKKSAKTSAKMKTSATFLLIYFGFLLICFADLLIFIFTRKSTKFLKTGKTLLKFS